MAFWCIKIEHLLAGQIQRATQPLAPFFTKHGLISHFEHGDDYHITLKFLTCIRQEEIAPMGELLAQAIKTSQAFMLTLHATSCFVMHGRSHPIWIGVMESAPLNALAGQVENALVRMGHPAEPRPFIPHLTIARIKGAPQLFRQAFDLAPRPTQSFSPFAVQEIHFMQRKKGTNPGEPLYASRFAIALGQSTAAQTTAHNSPAQN